MGRPKPKNSDGKPMQLIKETFDHKKWDDIANDWLSTNQYCKIKSKIKCAFFHFKTGSQGFCDPIQYMDKDNSKGFVILLSKLKEDYTLQDYRSLQHVLAMRLVEHKYIIKVSDIRSSHVSCQLQKTYRYYQKPSLKIQQTSPINQLFGNVTSELILKDGEPYMLRVMAHKYSDRNFADADGLDKMMNVILG